MHFLTPFLSQTPRIHSTLWLYHLLKYSLCPYSPRVKSDIIHFAKVRLAIALSPLRTLKHTPVQTNTSTSAWQTEVMSLNRPLPLPAFIYQHLDSTSCNIIFLSHLITVSITHSCSCAGMLILKTHLLLKHFTY